MINKVIIYIILIDLINMLILSYFEIQKDNNCFILNIIYFKYYFFNIKKFNIEENGQIYLAWLLGSANEM